MGEHSGNSIAMIVSKGLPARAGEFRRALVVVGRQ